MIISEIEALQQVVPIVRHHHEHFDGKGYPDGLAGEEIPIEARILTVVDAFDAMIHERSYRKALSREEALAELERGAGTQFDPAVVEAFLTWAATEGAEPEARKQPASADKRLATVRTTKTPNGGPVTCPAPRGQTATRKDPSQVFAVMSIPDMLASSSPERADPAASGDTGDVVALPPASALRRKQDHGRRS